MDELAINAKFNALIEQRNNALNQVVNLGAECALLTAKVAALEARLVADPAVVEQETGDA